MSIPWIEKYRPVQFSDIVLSRETRELIDKWFAKKKFPNMLLYGPPGTGKTTTAWNIIRKYQTEVEKQQITHIFSESQNVISLNASDENGVEIIRQRIHEFVKSKTLFSSNTKKFVILDEIDHMTSHAQRMLCFIIQEYSTNICYILMCNYISYLNTRLRNQVRVLPFYGMSKPNIRQYLLKICKNENIGGVANGNSLPAPLKPQRCVKGSEHLSKDASKVRKSSFSDKSVFRDGTPSNTPLDENSIVFEHLFSKYDCDIRSMINWLQQNSQSIKKYTTTIEYEWNQFKESLGSLESFIHLLSLQSNPQEYLMSILRYAKQHALMNPEIIKEGFQLKWNGELMMTGLTPIEQSDAYTELVAWYLKN